MATDSGNQRIVELEKVLMALLGSFTDERNVSGVIFELGAALQ